MAGAGADYDKDFINTFNEYYPFERYILTEPKSIDNLFDDAVLLEIFIPNTEIKPIIGSDGKPTKYWTKIDNDEIYVKIKGPAGVMRMGYFDFEPHIRENIRYIFYEDFGSYEWQSLYVEYEEEYEYDDLKEKLLKQKELITKQYGECEIKETPSSDLLV